MSKVKKAQLTPTAYYHKKISDTLYTITGNRRTRENDAVVLVVEKRLKEYLNGIRDAVMRNRCVGKRRKDFGFLRDVYEVLKGTTEYYGAQRSIIVKKLSKKYKKLEDGNVDDDDDGDDGDDHEQEPRDANPVEHPEQDDMQTELAKLNDNSRLYARFEAERLFALQNADRLTIEMSEREYCTVYRQAISKFIGDKRLFDQWMGWNKMGNDFYVLFAWLAVNRIRKMVKYAVIKQRQANHSLFVGDWTTFSRRHELQEEHFLHVDERSRSMSMFHGSESFCETNERFDMRTKRGEDALKTSFERIATLRHTKGKRSESARCSWN